MVPRISLSKKYNPAKKKIGRNDQNTGSDSRMENKTNVAIYKPCARDGVGEEVG
jgi:hypothetical protein